MRIKALLPLALLAGLLAAASTGASADTVPVRVLVVKLTWGPQPYTSGELDASMEAAERFYASASFGKVVLSYAQTPWLTGMSQAPPCPVGVAASAILATAASSASSSGYDASLYDRMIVLLPENGCAAFRGVTESNGIIVNTADPAVLVHELGHSFGMGHALAFECRTTPSNRRFCTVSGDAWDVMNATGKPTKDGSPVGDFGALQKTRAGWLAPTYLDKPGTYRLAALEDMSALPQALVIRTAAFEYWVDQRDPAGNDAYLAHDPLGFITAGFEVHRIIGDPVIADRYVLTPDYLMPTGKTNAYQTAPGSTFVLPGVFALGAVSHDSGVMTVRFRWLDKTSPTAPKYAGTGGANTAAKPTWIAFDGSSDRGSGVDRYLLTIDGRPGPTAAAPLLAPTGTPQNLPYIVNLPLPQLTPGKHKVAIVAVDRAGNRSAPTSAVLHS